PAAGAGEGAGGGTAELAALASGLGAGVWCEGIRARQVLPSAHPSFRLGLPLDTVAIRKALDGADVVLLIGGPFFEEVWYAPGSPLPEGALAIHVESSAERLAHNLAVRVGLVGRPRSVLSAMREDVARSASPAFREAAAKRNDALRALKRHRAR